MFETITTMQCISIIITSINISIAIFIYYMYKKTTKLGKSNEDKLNNILNNEQELIDLRKKLDDYRDRLITLGNRIKTLNNKNGELHEKNILLIQDNDSITINQNKDGGLTVEINND